MCRLQLAISSLALLLCTSQSASAQFIQPQRFEAGRISIDTATGSRCSSTGRDRASASLVGTGGEEAQVAAVISVPFGGKDQGDCSTLVKHEEARSRLDLAAQLFEAGAITPKQFEAIAADVAKLVL